MPDTISFGTPGIGVRTAHSGDAPRIYDILAHAFVGDPVARWVYPDPEQYRAFFPEFARLFAGEAILLNTAFVSEDGAAAALWHDPFSAADDDALGAFLDDSIAAPEKDTAFAVFEQMAAHHLDEPHWYLPLIGVCLEKQGLGYGGALLRQSLWLCDQTEMPCYLEATSARSVPLYRRFGFELAGEIAVGDCPPLYPMVRRPR